MKITIISNLYPPYILGGYELLCANVVDQLRSMDHEVSVLTSSHGVAGPLREKGIFRTLELYAPFSRAAEMEWRHRRRTYRHNYATAKKQLQQSRPDIVFVWSQLRLTTGAAMAAQQLGIPVAFTLNDDHLKSFVSPATHGTPRAAARHMLNLTLNKKLMLQNLKLDHVTCISACLKQSLLNLGVPIPDAEIIYQGIPLEQFPMKPTAPGKLHHPIRLLYSGQLHAYKGVHLALTALHQLNEKTPDAFTLTIAGGGPENYVNELHQQAKELEIESRVHFAGTVPRETLSQIYQENDILLVTSLWQEPFGLTHLEAMASGTPVISTFKGGMKEFLLNEENCITFNPEIPDELSNKIRLTADCQPLRENLIRNARTMVNEKFGLVRYAADLTGFLQRALEPRKN